MDIIIINISSDHFSVNCGNSFNNLFEVEELSDVTFVCSDGQHIKAHKIIPCSRNMSCALIKLKHRRLYLIATEL